MAITSVAKLDAMGHHPSKPEGEYVLNYLRYAAGIYRQSFAVIQAE